mmetsp:Transcript_532/g.887  ORF Transcript_532/g.887 Transcript_532/m.887 type:complete len:294 (-) Transcript_532:3294-4175(-)
MSYTGLSSEVCLGPDAPIVSRRAGTFLMSSAVRFSRAPRTWSWVLGVDSVMGWRRMSCASDAPISFADFCSISSVFAMRLRISSRYWAQLVCVSSSAKRALVTSRSLSLSSSLSFETCWLSSGVLEQRRFMPSVKAFWMMTNLLVMRAVTTIFSHSDPNSLIWENTVGWTITPIASSSNNDLSAAALPFIASLSGTTMLLTIFSETSTTDLRSSLASTDLVSMPAFPPSVRNQVMMACTWARQQRARLSATSCDEDACRIDASRGSPPSTNTLHHLGLLRGFVLSSTWLGERI